MNASIRLAEDELRAVYSTYPARSLAMLCEACRLGKLPPLRKLSGAGTVSEEHTLPHDPFTALRDGMRNPGD